MKRLFMSSFMLNILVMIINLVTGIMMARWLGTYGRGELAVATRWSALVIGLSTIGLPGAVVYLGKLNKGKQRELLGTYLVIGLFFGFIGMALGLLLIPMLMKGDSEGLTRNAALAMLSVPFSVLVDGFIGTLQSLNRFRKIMILRIMSPIGALLIIAGLHFSGMLTVTTYLWTFVFSWGFIIVLVSLYWVIKELKPQFTSFVENTRQLLGNGIKIYGGSLVGIFGGNFDQVILSLALGPYALGLYTVASSVGGVLPSVIFGTLNVFLWPKLMDLSGESRRRMVEQLHVLVLYGTAVIALAGMATLPFLLPMLYGQDFAPAVWMAIFLLAAAPIRICSQLLMYYLNTEGKFNLVSVSELISIVAGIGSMLLLMPVFGVEAAALGIVCGSLVKWFFYMFVANRLGISPLKLVLFKRKEIKQVYRLAARLPHLIARRQGRLAAKR